MWKRYLTSGPIWIFRSVPRMPDGDAREGAFGGAVSISTVVRAHSSAGGAKGGSMIRRLAARVVVSLQNCT